MKQGWRLFLFLILNIIVSAITVLVVLFIWDQLYGPMPRGLLSGSLEPRVQETPLPENTPQPVQVQPTPTEAFLFHQVLDGETFESIAQKYSVTIQELLAVNGFPQEGPLGPGEILRIPVNPKGSVEIDRVVAAGDLDSERVVLKHRGQGELSLVGWKIQDEKGNEFIFPNFPQLILFTDGTVNIYSKTGTNTAQDLYWGLSQAIWKSGITVSLVDGQGMVRDTYKIP